MESILYLGTEKGVITARSRDRRSWEITDTGLRNWEIPELAVSPDAPNKIFAGTRGDGVVCSEDFGKTWRKRCYGKRGPGKVRTVTVDPHDSRRLYAGCEPIDVWVSEDEGYNWRRFDAIWDIPFVATVPYPVPSVEPHVRDVTIDPRDPKVIYAALQVGYIVKSSDGGETWKVLDKNLDCDVHTIVIDPNDTAKLCVATGGHDCRLKKAPGRALYRSDDAGESWTPTAMNFTEEYSVPLAVDPRDPQLMYCALANGQPGQWRRRDSGAESSMIRSRDGGKTWESLKGNVSRADFPEVLLVDEDSDLIYAGTRGGSLYTSDDRGESWTPMKLDLKVRDLSSMALVHV